MPEHTRKQGIKQEGLKRRLKRNSGLSSGTEYKRLRNLIPFPFEIFVENPGLQHIGISILKFLDPKSFANCRLVSKGCKDLIEKDNTWWRMILKSEKIWEPCITFRDRFDFNRASYNDLIQSVRSISENETWVNIGLLGRFFLDLYLYKQEAKGQERWYKTGLMSKVSELLEEHNRTPSFGFSCPAMTLNLILFIYSFSPSVSPRSLRI